MIKIIPKLQSAAYREMKGVWVVVLIVCAMHAQFTFAGTTADLFHMIELEINVKDNYSLKIDLNILKNAFSKQRNT